MPQDTISDDDAVYFARAWRRSQGAGMDKGPQDLLFAWVRSTPPSRVMQALNTTHTPGEILALLDAARPEVTS